jgi:hypothetical protein
MQVNLEAPAGFHQESHLYRHHRAFKPPHKEDHISRDVSSKVGG